MEWSELARCLLTLKSIATNDECLDELLEGLHFHCQSVLRRFQQVPPATDVPLDPHKCLSGLLHTLVTVQQSFVLSNPFSALLFQIRIPNLDELKKYLSKRHTDPIHYPIFSNRFYSGIIRFHGLYFWF